VNRLDGRIDTLPQILWLQQKVTLDKAAETLTSAKGYTDTTATTLRSEAAAEQQRVLTW
jgi:hypothetical protein